ERFWVIEGEEIRGLVAGRAKVDPRERARYSLERRWGEPRLGERGAQRIDVAAERHAPREGSLDERGPATHERVVDDVAWSGEALDEKAWELRLETRAVRDFVQAVRVALFARPEFVDERLYAR